MKDMAKQRAILESTNDIVESEVRSRTDDLKKAQADLLQTEKLASVGQLAAGIAHEINTPIQFVGDNVRASSEMFKEFVHYFQEYKSLFDTSDQQNISSENASRLRELEETVDVDYIIEDIPKAFSQSLEGLNRVRTIVQAMKDFSHADKSSSQRCFDLNKELQSTLTVARNEIKYVSNLETDFGDLPHLKGVPSELNQVFLNMLVNAAHAIQDKGDEEMGTISVHTRVEGNSAVVSISDTGCGIPESIRHKLYEPFFTTKEVGRGSGQGLAISHNIVVERHKGRIEIETEQGVGTTFHIYLPIGNCPEELNHVQDQCVVC